MSDVLFTVIGDLVGSRQVADRHQVHTALGSALDGVNRVVAPAQPLEPTVADEFQGGYTTLAAAARATLLVRLALLPLVDARCGIGRGEVTVHDANHQPLLQDGPGWWAARAAVEALGTGRAQRRTWFVSPDLQPEPGTVNAFLTCRDQLLERLNERGLRILRLALLGHSQKEIAEAEHVWPSAVSQQFSRGVGAIVEAHTMLDRGRT